MGDADKQTIVDGNNKLEKFEPVSWSSKEKYEIASNEHDRHDDAIENFGSDEEDADGTEQAPVDLSNDIAINQMLADQGAPMNPDAEVFDINEYNADRQQSRKGTAMQALSQDQQAEAIEYVPFYHTNLKNQQNTVIDKKWTISNNVTIE